MSQKRVPERTNLFGEPSFPPGSLNISLFGWDCLFGPLDVEHSAPQDTNVGEVNKRNIYGFVGAVLPIIVKIPIFVVKAYVSALLLSEPASQKYSSPILKCVLNAIYTRCMRQSHVKRTHPFAMDFLLTGQNGMHILDENAARPKQRRRCTRLTCV